MMGNRTLSILWRILVFLVTLAIMIYVVVYFRVWGIEWSKWFLWHGNLWGWIFVSMVVTGICMVIVKLVQWQVRLETAPVKRRIRRRR